MNYWNKIILGQYGAALEMLRRAVEACPDKLWSDSDRDPQFWYLPYHTLFFADYYLSDSPDGFSPPEPFTLDELDPRRIIPDKPFTKEEIFRYIVHCRKKSRERVGGMTEERAQETSSFLQGDISNGELQIYNLRHIQHHAAQLNLILRQEIDSAPRWVRSA
ncbi:MAG: DinB family protein [Acidobacteria bacterium]|nr:MAG: DinB family protein [Acidobacteriota bacterium]REK03036.1 MAG: DinB family protein [Acidobacteriota bacterium]REK13160.1 MAG: DinB family protein [Acidobacteriota bacterium]REK41154.1 MAG: DinB family protein [Acidobacteriota bacterium]